MSKIPHLLQHSFKKEKRFLLGEGGKRVSVIIPHPQINPSHGLLSQRISNCRGEILI